MFIQFELYESAGLYIVEHKHTRMELLWIINIVM